MKNSEFISGSQLARTTVILIVLTLTFDFLFSGLELTNIIFFDGLSNLSGENQDTNGLFEIMILLISLVLTIIVFSTNIVFLMWQHRAANNLRAMNPNACSFTPGWHVGWWFIPFASLVMPLRCVSELANGSIPENAADETYVSNQSPSNLTGFWWFFYIFSSIIALANTAFGMSLSTIPENWKYYGISMVIFYSLYLVAGILVIRIVRDIDKNQEASFKLIGNRQEFYNPPPPPTFNNEAND